MIKTQAQVMKNGKDFLVVRCQQKTSCGSCASKGQCGTGIVSGAFPGKIFDISIPSALNLEVGTGVEIGLEEETLLKSALLVYILPLVFVVAGAFFGRFLAPIMMMGEGLIIFFSFLSGLVGLAVTRVFARKLERKLHTQPRFIRVLSCAPQKGVLINPTTEDSE